MLYSNGKKHKIIIASSGKPKVAMFRKNVAKIMDRLVTPILVNIPEREKHNADLITEGKRSAP